MLNNIGVYISASYNRISSESYIFGKFDMFVKRLECIREILNTADAYAPLLDIRLEGLDQLVTRYKMIFDNIKKRNYDMTDIRRAEVPHTHYSTHYFIH